MSEQHPPTAEELRDENRILHTAASRWDQLHALLIESQETLRKKYGQVTEIKERIERALKGGTLAWWDWDVASGSMFYNEERAHMLGYTMDELPTQMDDVLERIHPDDRQEVIKRIDAHKEGETPYYEAEYRLQSKEGRWKWFYDRGKVMQREIMGEPAVISGVLIDITDRKEAEKILTEARDLAHAANRAKSLFLSNMSHEIYTPMAGVIGMADILTQSDLAEEQREYIEILVKSANSLLSVLNDIMEFIQVENNQVVLATSPVYLVQLFQEMTRKTLEKCSVKGLELLTFFDARIPDVVMGDSRRISQLIGIFLHNAVKFTEEGSITLSVEFDSWDEDTLRLRFRIADTGIGIPEQERSRLFQSFTRLNTKIGKYGGSGLGLSIADHLVKLMHGLITVESEDGKGSVFTCTIEVERLVEQERFPDLTAVKGKKILLVDGEGIWRSLLRDTLLIWECDVEDVDDQESAMDSIRHQREAGTPFDVVILAYHPGMMLQKGFSPSILLLYQTHPFPEEEMKGIDPLVVLYRPFLPDQLLEAISISMAGNHQGVISLGRLSDAPSEETEKKVFRVLLVEDNLINQKVAQVTLNKLGHKTDLADNGRRAVEMVKETEYDLILMDVLMSELDGLGATREIRELEREMKRKPAFIAAITANLRMEDEKDCYDAGMNAYITKPFKIQELNGIFAKL